MLLPVDEADTSSDLTTAALAGGREELPDIGERPSHSELVSLLSWKQYNNTTIVSYLYSTVMAITVAILLTF